jgi:hypothetical protein
MFSGGSFSDNGFSDSGQTSTSNGEIIGLTLYIQRSITFVGSILSKKYIISRILRKLSVVGTILSVLAKFFNIKTKHETDI